MMDRIFLFSIKAARLEEYLKRVQAIHGEDLAAGWERVQVQTGLSEITRWRNLN
jgi:hypothetical protein